MPHPTFALTTLGVLKLEGPVGPLLSGRRKELVLLTYLAWHSPKPVPREELAALLWGERDEDKARQSLRQALHQLKQAVGTGIEVTAEHARVAEASIAVDAVLLVEDIGAGRLAEAVRRWNGEFLRGTEDAGDEPYRAWLEGQREALRRHVVTAFVGLIERERSEGRAAEELRWARTWVSQFPLDEAAHVRLVDALRRSGAVDEARSVHASFTSRLKRELDAEPSLELIRLGEQLGRSSSTERQRHGGSGALHAPALVGRASTIATSLVELWSRVRSEGSGVVLEGEPGTGRTRLCTELARRCMATMPPPLVLHASGEDEDSATDGATLRRLMSSLVQAPVLEDVPARSLAELAEVIPAIRHRFPQLGAASGRPDRIESSLRDVLKAIGSRMPVLVILDELHKADTTSLRFVRSLFTAIPQGTMVIATLPIEPTPGRLAKEFGELPLVRRFTLPPFTRAETEQAVESMIEMAPSTRRTLIDRLHEGTRGNPREVTARVSAMTQDGTLVMNDGGVWQLGPESPALTAPSSGSAENASVARRRRRRIGISIAAVLTVAAIPVARQVLSGEAVDTPVPIPRLAVLDLDVVSRDTLDAYVATGLVEEINASLSRIEGLRLKSRSVVRTSQARNADPVQLAKALDVDYVVEGALRRSGDELKVSIRLTKAADGFQVWSEDFNAGVALPQLHARVAQEVAARVGTQLAVRNDPATTALTSDVRAYEHYLRGNVYLARRTPLAVEQAIAQYRTAVARDTAFAAAWARIAYAYALQLDWGWAHTGTSNEQLFQDGLTFATRAIEIDSLSPDAWMAKAYLLETVDPVRMAGAADAFERAIQLNPRNAEAIHQYAQIHEAVGNWDASIAAFRRVLLLEPDRSLAYVAMASIAWKQGQPLVARRLYDSALVVDPGASYVLSARALLRLFALHDSVGGLEDAETAVRVSEGYSIPPHSALAIALARTGSRARAELEVNRALSEIADPSMPSPTDARWIASALLSVGRRSDALALLERAQPRGAWLWFYCLAADFDAIRSDPRFVRVMADAHPMDGIPGRR